MKKRFIKSVIEAARECDTPMPWARGARRAGFVAARRGAAGRGGPAGGMDRAMLRSA